MPYKTVHGNPRRKEPLFNLPAGEIPETDRCVSVWIPDSPEFLALLSAALSNLRNGGYYQKDPDKTGKLVADAFARSFAAHDLLPCSDVVEFGDEMQLRQNGCLLEFSLDCEHWFTLYDPTDCIQDIVSHPSGGGVLQPGQCREYDVSLSANSVWFLPFPVSTGFTIECTAARGAWAPTLSIGPEPVPWFCPDGRSYLLGACAGSPAPSEFGAEPSLDFMSLLSRIDLDTPVWFESLTGVQTVGADILNAALWFQANTNDLATAQGTIGFHLKVCNANSQTEWCYDYDFTGDGPFFGLTFGSKGHHVPGTGLVGDVVSEGSMSIIASLQFPNSQITHVSVTTCFSAAPTGGGAGSADAIYLDGSLIEWIDLGVVYSGCEPHAWDGNRQIDQIYINPSGICEEIKVTAVSIRGTGENPFGSNSCP